MKRRRPHGNIACFIVLLRGLLHDLKFHILPPRCTFASPFDDAGHAGRQHDISQWLLVTVEEMGGVRIFVALR